ncbi:hypothetical protein [Wenyingzhuangia sp. IMCC45574]
MKKRVLLASVESIINKHEDGQVYITSDTSSVYYDWLVPKEKVSREFLEKIEENSLQAISIDTLELSKKWMPIFLYQNEFYVYAPSDWISHRRVFIEKSYIHFYSSELVSYVVLNYRINSEGVYEFEIMNPYRAEKEFLLITDVDIDKGITLWEHLDENKKHQYSELRVKEENVKNFKMIVNDCFEQKCVDEFEMDKEEFGKLIKSIKSRKVIYQQ